MGPCRAAGEEDDDAGTLRDHAPRRTAGGDELRGQNGLGDRKFRHGQVDCGLAVAVFGDAGPGCVELDVDSSSLLNDPVEVLVDRAVVEGVDDRVAGPAARLGDLPGDSSESALGPAGKETSAPSAPNLRATAAPMEPPAPNTTARLSFKMGESFIVSSIRLTR